MSLFTLGRIYSQIEDAMRNSTAQEAGMLLDDIESKITEIPYGDEVYRYALKTFNALHTKAEL
jgi:hypothetical protein